MEIVAPIYLAAVMVLIIGEWIGSSKKSKGETK